MNALKHGLRSEQLVLPTEDAHAFAAYQATWVDGYDTADPATLLLVDRAVAAGWRLKRTDRVETDRIGRRINAILADWADDRRKELDDLVDLLSTAPHDAHDRLDDTREGRLRKVELWEEILDAAETPGGWSDRERHHDRLMNLHGFTANQVDGLDADEEAIFDLSFQLVATHNEEFRRADGVTPLPPEIAAMVEKNLAGLARARIAINTEEADLLPDPTPARLRRAEALACEIGPEDVALHRLQGRLEREARSAISGLARLRTARPKPDPGIADDPGPIATNEANPEAVRPIATIEANRAAEPTPAGPIATNEANRAVEPSPAGSVATNEDNRVVGVDPVAQADRDRGGRTWPVVEPGPDPSNR